MRDDGSVDLSKVTLTVGDQKGGSKALLQAAGALDDVPYKVEWKEFTSGPPLLEALNAGAIDVGGVGNTPPLFAAAANSKLKVVPGATTAARATRSWSRRAPRSRTSATSKGKKVAVAKGSSANYNLLAQLDKAGLSTSTRSTSSTSSPPTRWPRSAPATSTPGRSGTRTPRRPSVDAGARVIADGEGRGERNVFQAAPDSAGRQGDAAALKDYVGRLAEAKVWSDTHREEWAKVWAEETGLLPRTSPPAADGARNRAGPITTR